LSSQVYAYDHYVYLCEEDWLFDVYQIKFSIQERNEMPRTTITRGNNVENAKESKISNPKSNQIANKDSFLYLNHRTHDVHALLVTIANISGNTRSEEIYNGYVQFMGNIKRKPLKYSTILEHLADLYNEGIIQKKVEMQRDYCIYYSLDPKRFNKRKILEMLADVCPECGKHG
jgi:DNA-binding transcriptional ArsR family regulator